VFLTPEEVASLTGKQRGDAQRRALNFMGVEYKVRPDGSIAILRAHVERLFGGGASTERQRKKTAPDFSKVT
jgi:hypothetical protein